jgi:hypothetical protein
MPATKNNAIKPSCIHNKQVNTEKPLPEWLCVFDKLKAYSCINLAKYIWRFTCMDC